MLLQAERLVAKLQLEEEMEWNRKEEMRKAANPTVTLDLKVDQALSMMKHLREKTADIHVELEMRRRLKAEQERYQQAAAELREANLTAEERQLRAEGIRRGQILFSRIVAENHPDWRSQENSNAEFYRRQSVLAKKA